MPFLLAGTHIVFARFHPKALQGLQKNVSNKHRWHSKVKINGCGQKVRRNGQKREQCKQRLALGLKAQCGEKITISLTEHVWSMSTVPKEKNWPERIVVDVGARSRMRSRYPPT